MIRTNTLRVFLLAATACALSFAQSTRAASPADDAMPGDWTNGHLVTENGFRVSFRFPDSGYAFDNHEELVRQCMQAIKDNAALIGVSSLNDTLRVRFLRSRQEMEQVTSYAVAGFTNSHIKTLFIVASGDSNEVKPPIRHELMHLIAMISWGRPPRSTTWMNEGLAAFAENNCNGYTVAEIYRYFQAHDMLIPIDSLVSDFYGQPEMIAYHQSAFIVQYLLQSFGAEKLKQLWSNGFDSFAEIYGMPYSKFQSAISEKVRQGVPEAPEIDWDSFKEGCK